MAIRLLNATPQQVSWLLWAQPAERRRQGRALRAAPRMQRLIYQLLEPRPDGQTVLSLTPMEFLERLATPIPPPRRHRPSSHAILAPNAPLRAVVTAHAGLPMAVTAQGSSRPAPAPSQAATEKSRSPSTYWWRIFHSCCLRAAGENPEVFSEVLDALAGWISTVSRGPLPSDQR